MSRSFRGRGLGWVPCVAMVAGLGGFVGDAWADVPPEPVLATSYEALRLGAVREAIENCEAYADQGGRAPDVSYNRGLAYLARVREGDSHPGDLGRAAAAFEDTLVLRPEDPDAKGAVELVRSEVARRRARDGNPVEINASPGVLPALVGLATADVWGLLAALGSAMLTAGLLLRRASTPSFQRLTGNVFVAVGLVLLVLFASLTALTHRFAQAASIGVIVVPEARLLDDRSRPLPSAPALPEAARVTLLGRQEGGRWRVRWGRAEGLVAEGQLREIRPR